LSPVKQRIAQFSNILNVYSDAPKFRGIFFTAAERPPEMHRFGMQGGISPKWVVRNIVSVIIADLSDVVRIK
jgi:hypothetical protein